MSGIPSEAVAITKNLGSDCPDFTAEEKDVQEILRFRIKENIKHIIINMEQGEYAGELAQEMIEELKQTSHNDELVTYLFQSVTRLLQEENIDLKKFSTTQQIVVDGFSSQNQKGIFNKTLERLGHLKMVPEIHWRVDRTSEEYSRRFGLYLNRFLTERAKTNNKREILLEVGPGSGTAEPIKGKLRAGG